MRNTLGELSNYTEHQHISTPRMFIEKLPPPRQYHPYYDPPRSSYGSSGAIKKSGALHQSPFITKYTENDQQKYHSIGIFGKISNKVYDMLKGFYTSLFNPKQKRDDRIITLNKESEPDLIQNLQKVDFRDHPVSKLDFSNLKNIMNPSNNRLFSENLPKVNIPKLQGHSTSGLLNVSQNTENINQSFYNNLSNSQGNDIKVQNTSNLNHSFQSRVCHLDIPQQLERVLSGSHPEKKTKKGKMNLLRVISYLNKEMTGEKGFDRNKDIPLHPKVVKTSEQNFQFRWNRITQKYEGVQLYKKRKFEECEKNSIFNSSILADSTIEMEKDKTIIRPNLKQIKKIIPQLSKRMTTNIVIDLKGLSSENITLLSKPLEKQGLFLKNKNFGEDKSQAGDGKLGANNLIFEEDKNCSRSTDTDSEAALDQKKNLYSPLRKDNVAIQKKDSDCQTSPIQTQPSKLQFIAGTPQKPTSQVVPTMPNNLIETRAPEYISTLKEISTKQPAMVNSEELNHDLNKETRRIQVLKIPIQSTQKTTSISEEDHNMKTQNTEDKEQNKNNIDLKEQCQHSVLSQPDPLVAVIVNNDESNKSPLINKPAEDLVKQPITSILDSYKTVLKDPNHSLHNPFLISRTQSVPPTSNEIPIVHTQTSVSNFIFPLKQSDNSHHNLLNVIRQISSKEGSAEKPSDPNTTRIDPVKSNQRGVNLFSNPLTQPNSSNDLFSKGLPRVERQSIFQTNHNEGMDAERDGNMNHPLPQLSSNISFNTSNIPTNQNNLFQNSHQNQYNLFSGSSNLFPNSNSLHTNANNLFQNNQTSAIPNNLFQANSTHGSLFGNIQQSNHRNENSIIAPNNLNTSNIIASNSFDNSRAQQNRDLFLGVGNSSLNQPQIKQTEQRVIRKIALPTTAKGRERAF